MRWLVEVSSLGKTDTQKFCVDAESWQRALQAARLQRGEEGPMSGFSIELLEEGYRAVDPLARVRFVVKRAPDDMPLTPVPDKAPSNTTARGVAPAPQTKTVPPPAVVMAKSVPPPAMQVVPAVNITKSAPPPAASSLSADATLPNLPVAPTSSSPVTTPNGANGAAKKSPSIQPPRPNGSTAPKASTMVFASNGEASVSEKPVERAEPPAIGSSVPGLPAVKLLSSREQNPSDASPLTYREYAFAVPEGTSEEQAADVLRVQLRYVEAHIATSKMGKLVNLACFDIEFTGKPPRMPLATLTWKDWKGEPVVAFPKKGDSASKPPRPPSQTPASLEAGLAQGVPAVVVPPPAQLPNLGSSAQAIPSASSSIAAAVIPAPSSLVAATASSASVPVAAAASSAPIAAAAKSSSRPPAPQETTAPMVAREAVQAANDAVAAQQAAQQAAAQQAAQQAAAQQAAAQQAAAQQAASEQAALQQAAAQQAAAQQAAAEAAAREAAAQQAAAQQAAAQQAAAEQAAAQQAAAQQAAAQQAAQQAAAEQAAAQQAAAQQAAAQQAAAEQAAAQQAAAQQAAAQQAAAQAAAQPQQPSGFPAHANATAHSSAFPPPNGHSNGFPAPAAPTAQGVPVFAEADPMKPVGPAAQGTNMVRTPSGRFVRGRITGDELITSLFESMHDLHFLRDALDGGQFCLALATEVLPARAALIHFFDLGKREWVVACTRGKDTPRLLTMRSPEGDEILREAARRRRAMVIPNAETATGERYRQLGGSRSLIIAPIMQGGRALGALEIINPLDGMPFTEDEGNAMTYIAEQFAEYLGSRGIVLDHARIQSAATR